MRIIFFIFCFFYFFSVSAHLEFYYNDEVPYDNQRITSPENGWGFLHIYHTSRSLPLPTELTRIETISRENIETIIKTVYEETYEESEQEQFITELVEVIDSIENSQFKKYISIATSERTDQIIEEKLSNNIVLSPYEEMFLTCDIPLNERQKIVINILENFRDEGISLDSISYLNPDFWDCIIPFPDITRGDDSTDIWETRITRFIQDTHPHFDISEEIHQQAKQEEKIFNFFSRQENMYDGLLQKNQINSIIYSRLYDRMRETQACITSINLGNTPFLNDDIYIFLGWIENNYIDISEYFLEQHNKWHLDVKNYIHAQARVGEFICNFSQTLEQYSIWNITESDFNHRTYNLINAYESYYGNILRSTSLSIGESKNINIFLILWMIVFLTTIAWLYFFYNSRYFPFTLWKK